MNTDKSMDKERRYWRRLYIVVVLFLIIQIIGYYFITRHFSGH